MTSALGRILRITAIVNEGGEMLVKRCFFPSRGRIARRINHRKQNGQVFVGSV
jgi:hypothetical protein